MTNSDYVTIDSSPGERRVPACGSHTAPPGLSSSLLGRRFRHRYGERLDIGDLDVIALLDVLQLVRVLYVDIDLVALGATERHHLLRRIDGDDLGHRGHLARDRATRFCAGGGRRGDR